MVAARAKKIKFVDSFSAVLLFLAIGTCLCMAQGQRTIQGELKLEGEHIERLVLQEKNGSGQTFDHPGKTIRLPVGEYRLRDVYLKGGYNHRNHYATPDKTGHWVTVAEDKSAILKVGAPLKQTIKVERQGQILILNYELCGTGDETYTVEDRGKLPTFIVYKNDKEIASGKFEYG